MTSAPGFVLHVYSMTPAPVLFCFLLLAEGPWLQFFITSSRTPALFFFIFLFFIASNMTPAPGLFILFIASSILQAIKIKIKTRGKA